MCDNVTFGSLLEYFEECDITLKYFKEGMTIYNFLTFDHFKRSLKCTKVNFRFADVLNVEC